LQAISTARCAGFVGLSVASHSGNVAQMPMAFDEAFRQVKQLVADFLANEKFYLSPTCLI
jgi:creatinine amidohydrolase/Fe(II)-dependent formamide hydrolase-like protein